MSELDDLRQQNRALDEQIKTLVRTEARLHKSQNEVDRQIARIELLSRFSLRWTSHSTPREILVAATELFVRLFSAEWVKVVVLDPTQVPSDSFDVGPFIWPELFEQISAELSEMPPVVTTRPDFLKAAPSLAQVLPPEPVNLNPAALHVLLPLRDRDLGGPGFLLVALGKVLKSSSHLKEAPKEGEPQEPRTQQVPATS